MNPIVIIPARLKSIRFPNKILLDISGLPMIEHVRRRVLLSNYVNDVYIATCDNEIKESLEPYGANIIMTSDNHTNGTSRVAEAVNKIECNKIILVQGDEPLLLPEQLDKMTETLMNDNKSIAWNATGPIENENELYKNSFVKCSVINSRIHHCFRQPSRFKDFENYKEKIRKVLGLIAFKKDFLIELAKLKSSSIESIESIEQMRIIEYGYKLTSVAFDKTQASINEPEDLEVVLKVFREENEQKNLLNEVLNYRL